MVSTAALVIGAVILLFLVSQSQTGTVGLPTADFTWSPSSPIVGEQITFDASGSSDPDGLIEFYDWDFGDGATGTGETTTHTYDAQANYEVTLTVTDNAGNQDSITQTVTVLSSQLSPAEPSGTRENV